MRGVPSSPDAALPASSSSLWYNQRKLWIAVIACVALSEGLGRILEESPFPEDATGILRLNELTPATIQTSTTPSFGFYLFGDIPYAEWEERILQDQMNTLTKHRLNHTLFSVHVGDLQKTARSLCQDEYYLKIRNILRTGPLPTYVLLGDNDWYDCPKPKQALEYFGKHFFSFHKQWSQQMDLDPLGIQHMDTLQHRKHPELFAFAHESILFISVHLINGNPGDEPAEEWDYRMETNIQWVRENVETYCSRSNIRGVILLGHSLRSPRTRPLFEGIVDTFRTVKSRAKLPVLYLHGDGHDWDMDNKLSQQLGWLNFWDVQVDQGALADPILVEIASFDVHGKMVPLKVENDKQVVFGRGLIRIDRQRGKYGTDYVNAFKFHHKKM